MKSFQYLVCFYLYCLSFLVIFWYIEKVLRIRTQRKAGDVVCPLRSDICCKALAGVRDHAQIRPGGWGSGEAI